MEKRMIDIFGEGKLYKEDILYGKTYVVCTACMSIYSEFLSWANTHIDYFVNVPDYADNIIILSCQVTDLAILYDLRYLEWYMYLFPSKNFYIGGCLAKRFDILLPQKVKRLDNIYIDYSHINQKWMVKYAVPFWVQNFDINSSDDLDDGNLFRKMYPLRIGRGCRNKCTYCTIRHTRGAYQELDINRCSCEFIKHNWKDVVLIADSISKEQLQTWVQIAKEENKTVSFRNVEPNIVLSCENELLDLASKHLLKILHCPIQSTNKWILRDMGRSYDDVEKVSVFVSELRKLGVKCATNVIIDYKNFSNPVLYMEKLQQDFDYVSWNPYWDGKWDREKAESRFNYYLNK